MSVHTTNVIAFKFDVIVMHTLLIASSYLHSSGTSFVVRFGVIAVIIIMFGLLVVSSVLVAVFIVLVAFVNVLDIFTVFIVIVVGTVVVIKIEVFNNRVEISIVLNDVIVVGIDISVSGILDEIAWASLNVVYLAYCIVFGVFLDFKALRVSQLTAVLVSANPIDLVCIHFEVYWI